MTKTKIEWCDYTWNPVTGCLRGCEQEQPWEVKNEAD